MSTRLPCLFLAVLLLVASTAGCASGPWKLRKSWDDTTANLYSQNAWLHGALLQDVIPAYPIVGLFMAIGDVLFVNPYYFWGYDAWSGKGTAFVHQQPSGPNSVGNVFGGSSASGTWGKK